jgi:predicted ester cyclase
VATTSTDPAAIARYAIERVCSGQDLDAAGEVYSPRFVDHVNAMDFHGMEGIQRSVGLYKRLFEDLRFETLQQVADGDTVATRWALHGTFRGRRVSHTGVTISRVEDGKIVEDWSHSDTIDLARQLGLWRSVVVVAREWRALLGRG